MEFLPGKNGNDSAKQPTAGPEDGNSLAQAAQTGEMRSHAPDTRILDTRSYEEKLRDPRWQRRRLEIFQRDKWICQLCSRTDLELHVHHLRRTTENPWEEPDLHLLTVCRLCHEQQPANPFGRVNNPKRLYVPDVEWWEKHGRGYSVELQEALDKTTVSDSTVEGLSRRLRRIDETVHLLRLDWEKNGYPAEICRLYLYRPSPFEEPVKLEQDELATAFEEGGPEAVRELLQLREAEKTS